MDNPVSGKAKEACESCRKSRKKCAYTSESTSCVRCERRGTPCSLFPHSTTQDSAPHSFGYTPPLPPVNTQCASLMEPNSAPDSLGVTPHDSATASSISPYALPGQEGLIYTHTEAAMGQYCPNPDFQSAQFTLYQGVFYDGDGLFGDHDST